MSSFYIPIQRFVIGIVLIAATALIAGIVPGMQALRLQIADALRR